MSIIPDGVYAIVPAAGSGSRVGAEVPKPLLRLADRTILERTLETLCSVAAIEQIIVLVPSQYQKQFQTIVDRFSRVALAYGGASRQASVRTGLAWLKERLDADRRDVSSGSSLVLVHDAARCFVARETIERAISAARERRAVTVAVPVADSIKRVSAGVVESSLERRDLWLVQTPQIFDFDLLWRAHARSPVGVPDATDDAALVEPLHPVAIVPGTKLNFKITDPDDLRLAEILASAIDRGALSSSG